MKIRYAVAQLKGKCEEYMRETHGDDCFTDDLAHAILFDSEEEANLHLLDDYFVAEIEEDEDGWLFRFGT